MTPTCEEKATWRKGEWSDRDMMRRVMDVRTRRRRYTTALHKAARQIREERRPRLSTEVLAR